MSLTTPPASEVLGIDTTDGYVGLYFGWEKRCSIVPVSSAGLAQLMALFNRAQLIVCFSGDRGDPDYDRASLVANFTRVGLAFDLSWFNARYRNILLDLWTMPEHRFYTYGRGKDAIFEYHFKGKGRNPRGLVKDPHQRDAQIDAYRHFRLWEFWAAARQT